MALRWIVGLAAGLIGISTFAYAYWHDDIIKASLDPGQPFQTYTPPPAPDYAHPSAWYLHPGPVRGTVSADIFFVHSTSFYGGKDWLGRIDDSVASRRVINSSLPNFAGPFASLGRVFAPRYRQASLYAYRLTQREDAQEARAFAYGDVQKAFQTFLDHDSRSGPIIIAGVGQGAQLVERVVREVITNPAIRNRIVAVYLMEELTPEAAFPPNGPLPVCARRHQARCVVAWYSLDSNRDLAERIRSRTLVWDNESSFTRLADSKTICVNPLTGGHDENLGDVAANLGATNATGQTFSGHPTLYPHQVEAQCEDGMLRVSTPENPTLRQTGDWADRLRAPAFNLFYADIEADARTRLSVWYGGPLAAPITQTVNVRPSPIHRISAR